MSRTEILNNIEEKLLKASIDLGFTNKYGSSNILIGKIQKYQNEIDLIKTYIEIEDALINFPLNIYGLIGEYHTAANIVGHFFTTK